MLGNIRFIGELGKLAVVHEGILHKCIQQLLEKKRGLSFTDQAEDLECLCQIMRTVGKRLDTSKAKLWMDQYFERMVSLQQSDEMLSRNRFMLQDVIEMRRNNWEPRHVAQEMTPQTLGQIRKMMTPNRPSTEMPMSRGPQTAVNPGLVDIFGMPMMKKVSSAGSLTTMTSTTENYNRSISPGPSTRNYSRTDGSGYAEYFDKERSDKDGGPVQRDYNGSRNMENKDGVRTRDQMPRLTNKSLAGMGGDKLSLRPGSGMAPSFKPSSPHQLPKSARSTNQSPVPPEMVRDAPIFTKPPAVIIKQENRQKNKKQTGDSRSSSGQTAKPLSENAKCDKLAKAAENVCDAGGENEARDMDELCQLFRDLSLSKSSLSKWLTKLTVQTLKKENPDSVDRFSALVLRLMSSDLISASTLESVLSSQVMDVEHMELSNPTVKELICRLLVSFVIAETIGLGAVCKMFEGGHGHPMALQLLGLLAEKNGIDWLKREISSQKVILTKLIPNGQQKDDQVLGLLEECNISHLMPVLKLQKQLWGQINADPNPSSLFKWIMKNMESTIEDDQFTRVLFKTLLKYISSVSSLKDDTDRVSLPEKSVQEQEKAFFTKYQDIMLRFLHGSHHQQMVALYSLQQFCHEHNFPKGMMLRSFTYLYDLEIIDEDVFLKWKEDINETYPGKGKALFEVNQWLMWLEQAESESEEDEEDE